MEKFFNLPHLATKLDLAHEATAILRGAADIEIAGISEEVREDENVTIHTVTVLDERGSSAINKPRGKYITFDLPKLSESKIFGAVATIVSRELNLLLPPLNGQTLLIVGLGNNDAVPDSLGPSVVERTYATRHICKNGSPPEGLGIVCSLAPGVLGVSGIETAEIVRGVCDRLHPAALIAVDALAAASIARVGTTIQMTDSGISPGSGIGSGRAALNKNTLGCPVVAIGVPTVVDTSAIIYEALTALKEHWSKTALVLPPDIDDTACEYAAHRLLNAFNGRLMVTPKDIDQLIADTAELIAAAAAISVHPACNADNYHDFIK